MSIKRSQKFRGGAAANAQNNNSNEVKRKKSWNTKSRAILEEKKRGMIGKKPLVGPPPLTPILVRKRQ